MSFENLLLDAPPKEFALAAKKLAQHVLQTQAESGDAYKDRTIVAAEWIVSRTHEELIEFKVRVDARRAAEAARSET